MSDTSRAADAVRIKHGIDEVEPPISVLARVLVNKNGVPVLDISEFAQEIPPAAIEFLKTGAGGGGAKVSIQGSQHPSNPSVGDIHLVKTNNTINWGAVWDGSDWRSFIYPWSDIANQFSTHASQINTLTAGLQLCQEVDTLAWLENLGVPAISSWCAQAVAAGIMVYVNPTHGLVASISNISSGSIPTPLPIGLRVFDASGADQPMWAALPTPPVGIRQYIVPWAGFILSEWQAFLLELSLAAASDGYCAGDFGGMNDTFLFDPDITAYLNALRDKNWSLALPSLPAPDTMGFSQVMILNFGVQGAPDWPSLAYGVELMSVLGPADFTQYGGSLYYLSSLLSNLNLYPADLVSIYTPGKGGVLSPDPGSEVTVGPNSDDQYRFFTSIMDDETTYGIRYERILNGVSEGTVVTGIPVSSDWYQYPMGYNINGNTCITQYQGTWYAFAN